MVSYLVKARRRLDAFIELDELSTAQSKSIGREARGPYSLADEKVFQIIGVDPFQTLTNRELFKRYWKPANSRLERKVSREAFRAICNRIRRHHGFPASAAIKKQINAPKG